MRTNLIGRPVSYFDRSKPTKEDPDGTEYLGVICAVFDQPHPQFAPRVVIETPSGQLISAPIDNVWLLTKPDGTPTALGADIAARFEDATDGGASQTGG